MAEMPWDVIDVLPYTTTVTTNPFSIPIETSETSITATYIESYFGSLLRYHEANRKRM